jgi:hypothetical protein
VWDAEDHSSGSCSDDGCHVPRGADSTCIGSRNLHHRGSHKLRIWAGVLHWRPNLHRRPRKTENGFLATEEAGVGRHLERHELSCSRRMPAVPESESSWAVGRAMSTLDLVPCTHRLCTHLQLPGARCHIHSRPDPKAAFQYPTRRKDYVYVNRADSWAFRNRDVLRPLPRRGVPLSPQV